MTNSELVEHTYKKHHTWLSQVAYNFTKNKDKAEELVQDLYLKLMEYKDITKIMYNNDINLFYLYKMLRSIFINANKKQINHLPIDDDLVNLPADSYDYGADNDFETMVLLTNQALDKFNWFDSHLLRVYLDEGHSIQSLHKATRISASTIWSSQQKTKKYVREYIRKNMQ
jgi:DNA-directed RNA polymerase specialized sigma24 family protein